MKKQILAGTTALALAMGMTTSAMAFDQGGRGFHAGRSHGGFGSSRFSGVRGLSGWRHGDWGSRQFDGGYGGRGYGGPYYHSHPIGLHLRTSDALRLRTRHLHRRLVLLGAHLQVFWISAKTRFGGKSRAGLAKEC